MTTTINATPAKLRNGTWGARVRGTVAVGALLTIQTQAGKTWQATVSSIVWSGEGVTLVSTQSADRAPAPSSSPRSQGRNGRAGKWTGCSCGSREDSCGDLIPSSRNCSSCEHDA